MFNAPFSFEGRIRRIEYGFSLLFYIVAVQILNYFIEDTSVLGFAFLYIPLIWFIWAQGAKRCHDLGNSGWWQIVPFYVLWMLFQDGQPYTNSHGNNPKGIGHSLNTLSEQFSSHPITSNQAKKQQVQEENFSVEKTLLEVQNASYGNIQDIVRQLRDVEGVHQLSHEYLNTAGTVTVGHSGSSQQLLEEFLAMAPNVEVLQITSGHIIIKL